MPELALDDDRGTPSRSISTRARGPAGAARSAPHAGLRATRRSSERAAAAAHGRPRVGPLMTQNSGPTGSSHARQPGLELLPAPVVHADLSAPAALAAADQQRAAARVEVGLGERERLVMRSPARQRTTIRPRSRRPWTPSPAPRMTATISSTVGGSAG